MMKFQKYKLMHMVNQAQNSSKSQPFEDAELVLNEPYALLHDSIVLFLGSKLV